jgi:hypothetical protein
MENGIILFPLINLTILFIDTYLFGPPKRRKQPERYAA